MINCDFFEQRKKLKICRRSSCTTACCVTMLSRTMGVPECIPIRSFSCSSGRCRILNFFTSLSNERAIRAMCTAWANPLRIGSPETHCELGQSCVGKTLLHYHTSTMLKPSNPTFLLPRHSTACLPCMNPRWSPLCTHRGVWWWCQSMCSWKNMYDSKTCNMALE